MWRTIVAIICILLIIGGGISVQMYFKNTFAQIESNLLSALAAGEMGMTYLEAPLLTAYKHWEKNTDLLCTLVVHNRIESISVTFQQAFSFAQTGENPEYCAALRQILTELQYVKQYDVPSMANIF